MPWTPAHPAFALPFFKFFHQPFVVACLVIGSIAPDLPYFFLVRFVGWGHEFPMSFLFGVPITLIIAFIWARFLRPALLASLPITSNLATYPTVSNKDLGLGCIAAAIGIITHLFVDAFTHTNGYAVVNIPSLHYSLIVFGHVIPLWHVLQYVLSAFGAAVIFYYIFQSRYWHLTRRWRINMYTKKFWGVSATASCLTELSTLYLRWPFSHLTVVIVGLITSLITGMLLASFIYRPTHMASKTEPQQHKF